MGGRELTELGEWYVERSRDYRPLGKPRFIDKLNSNWIHVGLIRRILPNARIIDLRRNALDCCWSNFKMLFAEGHIASNDQRDIARFYRDYVHMVEAVDTAAPGGILERPLRRIVDDVEGQTRRILDFLGLEYEPACIDFHLSTERRRNAEQRAGAAADQPRQHRLGGALSRVARADDRGTRRARDIAQAAPVSLASKRGSMPSALNAAPHRSSVGVSNRMLVFEPAANQPWRVISSSSWPSPQPA